MKHGSRIMFADKKYTAYALLAQVKFFKGVRTFLYKRDMSH